MKAGVCTYLLLFVVFVFGVFVVIVVITDGNFGFYCGIFMGMPKKYASVLLAPLAC